MTLTMLSARSSEPSAISDGCSQITFNNSAEQGIWTYMYSVVYPGTSHHFAKFTGPVHSDEYVQSSKIIRFPRHACFFNGPQWTKTGSSWLYDRQSDSVFMLLSDVSDGASFPSYADTLGEHFKHMINNEPMLRYVRTPQKSAPAWKRKSASDTCFF